ncbi:AlpA family phage regulatory protein [Maribius pontilimi]|uniref:AlpA family phage regulatory protein n=1 Tax=Palleronia pontilimi TaxID=1964209 RepID=A0A934MEV2_9RHOB|nr:AlpA family phage regulatory protein [Palleronia pontilimi]MBJ3763831.1 AlpA family phage regulatory protein [Palleronia pontilimi]
MSDPDRIIRLNTVLDRTGLSRSTIYRKIAEGTFPAQLRISVHGAGWRESEISRWVEDPMGWRPEDETVATPQRHERQGQLQRRY